MEERGGVTAGVTLSRGEGMESRVQVESDTSSAVEGNERCASDCVCARSLSRVRLFATPWTVAHQALLSIKFSRQEYWSGFQFLLPRPGTEPISLESPELAGGFFTTSPPAKPMCLSSFLTGRGKKAIKHTWYNWHSRISKQRVLLELLPRTILLILALRASTCKWPITKVSCKVL